MMALCGLAVASVIAVVIFVSLYWGLGSADYLSKKQIISLVNENEGLLTSFVEGSRDTDNPLYESILEIKGLKKVAFEHDGIDFDCGGKGFGPNTSYYGFYYSENLYNYNGPKWCSPAFYELTQEGKGWMWRQEVGDNRYYTEHIVGDFYYYEAHF